MKNNDYLLPGIAAIFVAVLFPLSWIIELTSSLTSISEYQFSFRFGASSFLFLIVGLATVYIYYYFMKLLHDHHNYRRADFAFIAMIMLNAIFYFGAFILDITSIWINPLISLAVSSWIFGASIIIFGIIDVLIAVTLLIAHKDLPGKFTVFATINLIMGVFELTFVLSPVVLVLFPVVAILIAFIFLKKPETIEIV